MNESKWKTCLLVLYSKLMKQYAPDMILLYTCVDYRYDSTHNTDTNYIGVVHTVLMTLPTNE